MMIEFEVLDGPEATQNRQDEFLQFVTDGGAVEGYYVRQGIDRAGAKLVFAKSDGVTVGVAALKVPSNEYRRGLEEKSGYQLDQKLYPFELGYVAVPPEHSGRGIAKGLVEQVLALADGDGIFATTSNSAMKCTILPKFGFSQAGSPWKNNQQEELHLMTTSSTDSN